jgi:hypothetical protein
VGNELGLDDVSLASIKSEARKTLIQTGKPQLQPRALERQAEGVASRARDSAGDAKQKLAEAGQAAEQKAREAADSVATGVSKAAVWAFVGLVLGFFAAAAGGWLGAPDRTPIMRRTRRLTSRAAA